MPTLRVVFGTVILTVSLSAQLEERAADMVRRALVDDRAHAMLRSLCEVAPHRLSGSPGNAAAVEWAVQTMTALGLENVRREPISVPRWVRGQRCDVRLVGPADGLDGRLAALALGGSVGTDQPLQAAVIAVKDFNELKRRREEARGKIVLFDRPFDRSLVLTGVGYGSAVPQRTDGAAEAARVGAIAALVRSVTSKNDDTPHTGAMRYAPEVPKIPAVAISVIAADRIAAHLARGETVTVRLDLDCQTLPDAPSANVVGEIVGSELPKEIVLIGGHLDGWDVGQGAHDDAAGCCHCLEAARLILATGPRPKRTVRVVLFNNEENGLAGGKGYAERHAGAAAGHVAALETDSGGFAPRGFGISAGPGGLESLATLGRLLEDHEIGPLRRGGGGADVEPLGAFGVPTLGLRTAPERYFDLHHSAHDVVAAVHPRELALGAAAIAIVAVALADAETPLPRQVR